MTKSASRSIGAATSSVSMEVPLGRAAPPEAKKPLRTSQRAWLRVSSVEKSIMVAPWRASSPTALATSLEGLGVGAVTSISTAGELSVS